MILLIGNYDCFTYTLVQFLGDLGGETTVYRNDKITVDEVFAQKPEGLVISAGPRDPGHAGICLWLVPWAADENMPLFGVCLGHQTIGQVFGGKVIKSKPYHGKTSNITHTDLSVFKDLPSPLEITRYHSLIVERDSLPDSLEITAETNDGIVMGLQHKTAPIHGVQFHPESIATQEGHAMLKNFLNIL